MTGSDLATTGTLVLRRTSAARPPVRFRTHALPRRGLPREALLWRLRMLPRVLWQAFTVAVTVAVARIFHVTTMYGRLSLRVTRDGRELDYGIAGYRVVTTAGVNYLVDCLENLQEPENLKYHGFGTGTNAEAVGDTALQTELTTQYLTDNTRPTGTQTENGANVYETVATLDPDAAVTITEHGIFSQAATGGGTLLDRTVFSAINLAATGDTLQATYDLTLTSGG
jgi:hypothetical protein